MTEDNRDIEFERAHPGSFNRGIQIPVSSKTFQHTYICPSVACLKASNPHPGSWHQRAINLATASPRNDVKCPGCDGAMIIGRNGNSDTYKTDRDGNLRSIGGDALIFEKTAAEAPDQSGDDSIFLKDGK